MTIDKILELSVVTDVPATILTLDYLNYRDMGLKDKVAYQMLEIKYLEKIGTDNICYDKIFH